MSKSIIASIFLACLVAGATCGIFTSKDEKHDGDFYALNQYLDQNVRTQDSSAILDYLKTYMASLKDEPVKKAAELVVEVAKMDKHCNQEVLPTLIQLARANVTTYYGVDYRANPILESLGLRAIVDDCPAKLWDMYKAIKDTMVGKGFGTFMESFYAMKHMRLYAGNSEKLPQDHVVRQVSSLITADKKAHHDEVNGSSSKTVKPADKVREAIETYLLKPCRELLSDPRLEMLIQGKNAVTMLKPQGSLPEYLHTQVRGLAWKSNRCNEFLEMKDSARAKYFKHLTFDS